MSNQPKIVFFGMRCAFSVPALAALLAAGLDLRAIVLPGAPAGPPVSTQAPAQTNRVVPLATSHVTVDSLARAASVPVLAVGALDHPAVMAAFAAYEPDVIAVACFPRRLPTALLDLPPLGAVNVHPSLLPVGRGPEPIFWTFRRGDRQTGVTIHRMSPAFDAGPIMLQEAIDLPAGIRAPDLEDRLSAIGGRLLVQAIAFLVTKTASFTPQDDALATAAPIPRSDDYTVPTNRSAEWAYGFVRGVAPLGGPLTIVVLATGERIAVRDAVSVDPNARIDRPVIRQNGLLTVQFSPGTAQFAVSLPA